jgi:hypothetical protein
MADNVESRLEMPLHDSAGFANEARGPSAGAWLSTSAPA